MEHKPYHLCFETLSNDLRLGIIEALREGPKSVNQLAEELQVERSRLSHALQMLRACSHVTAAKQGRERVYTLNETVLTQPVPSGVNLFNVIDEHVDSCCGGTCQKQALLKVRH